MVGFGQAPERGGGQSKCLIADSSTSLTRISVELDQTKFFKTNVLYDIPLEGGV